MFTVWIWHIPALYNEAITNEALHFLQHVIFVSAAIFFWWIAIDPVPLKPRLLVLVATAVPLPRDAAEHGAGGDHHALGGRAVHVLPESVPRLWGLTPGEDQMIAGLIMWIPGAGIYFTVLTALFFVMLYKDDERMRRLEGRPVSGPRRW